MNTEEMKDIYIEWKKKYTYAVIGLLSPFGDVLQVGFDLEAANLLQTFHPKSHTIIEEDSSLLEEMVEWTKKHPNTSFIQEAWQIALPKLKSFDTVFFDQYPQKDVVKTINFLFPDPNAAIFDRVKEVLKDAEAQLASITTHYSDEQIDDFYEKTGHLNPRELPAFFERVRKNKNISEEQYQRAFKKYHLDELKRGIYRNQPVEFVKEIDSMFEFLKACLEGHMREGSCFSCYLNSQVSKYEDADFFEHIITNPFIDYEEVSVPISMSDRPRNGLVLLLKKN